MLKNQPMNAFTKKNINKNIVEQQPANREIIPRVGQGRHTCNPSIEEVEVDGLRVCLGYILRYCSPQKRPSMVAHASNPSY
jgi:hypothetical protein